MNLTPDVAIEDLKRYVGRFGLVISEDAESIFRRAEEIGYQYNYYPYPWVFLCAVLENVKKLQSLVIRKGGDPVAGAACVIQEIEAGDDDPYGVGEIPYSDLEHRGTPRTTLIDLAISSARRRERSELLDVDIVEALLEYHDQIFPPISNAAWKDEELKTPYNTLAHIVCGCIKSLWVRFDDIRQELGLLDPASLRKMPVESAPPSVRSAVLSLLTDYPAYLRNCFLIMSFETTPTHRRIYESLKTSLAKHGLNLLRADEKSYSDDLLTNIEAYIYGCHFAIAVYERITSEIYNPNISFEVGYFMGLKKPTCLLKEKTLKTLHSDLIGKLYIEFDAQDIEGTIPPRVEKWLRDKEIID